MKTGKFSNNLGVTDMGLMSGAESSNSTFKNVGDWLDPLRKSVKLDVSSKNVSHFKARKLQKRFFSAEVLYEKNKYIINASLIP